MIDHNRLGRELGLFYSDPLVGAGLPMWLPDGAAARHAVEEYVRELERRAGYQHVYSPPLAKKRAYEISGHLAHFGDEMFPPMALSVEDEFIIRPSLCPHHALIYASRGRSYRELPMRLAELGGQYRAERSGVVGGLSRVRCAPAWRTRAWRMSKRKVRLPSMARRSTFRCTMRRAGRTPSRPSSSTSTSRAGLVCPMLMVIVSAAGP
jgi:hypothetical protein